MLKEDTAEATPHYAEATPVLVALWNNIALCQIRLHLLVGVLFFVLCCCVVVVVVFVLCLNGLESAGWCRGLVERTSGED